MTRRWSWILLVGLLLALLAAAVRSDAVVGGERETTFRMAALSLAWDGDLTYGRADYDRYVRLFGREPEAVALESGAGGARIGFARPPAYAILAAPFVRVSPRRGPALLNWLLLAVAATGSALVLERRAGPWAPAWIALFLAGTTAFTLLPLASPGTFRLAASALAWALVVHAMPLEGRRPLRADALRWSLAGSLLALATVASVDGLTLLPALAAAAWLALSRPRRGVAVLALAAAAALTAGASFGVSALARGGLGPVERAVFSPSTGYPAVDFKAAEWRRPAASAAGAASGRGGLDFPATGTAARHGLDLRAAGGIDPETALHALAGRTVGIAPYGAPLVAAALWGLLATGWRRVLLLAALASVAARVVFFPFDLGDESALVGPGGVGAVLPMFWFLAARLGPVRMAVVAASSALFLHPLWLRPVAAMDPSPAPESVLHRLLPAETGQRPRAGEPADLFVGDVWLRPVAGGMTPFGESGLLIEGGSAEFFVAWRPAADAGNAQARDLDPERRPAAVEAGDAQARALGPERRSDGGAGRPERRVVLEHDAAGLAVAGGAVEETRPLPSGRTSVRLLLDPPEARHRAWWSPGRRVELHRLRLTLDDGGAPFALHLVRIGSAR